jgi:hypothetical protein
MRRRQAIAAHALQALPARRGRRHPCLAQWEHLPVRRKSFAVHALKALSPTRRSSRSACPAHLGTSVRLEAEHQLFPIARRAPSYHLMTPPSVCPARRDRSVLAGLLHRLFVHQGRLQAPTVQRSARAAPVAPTRASVARRAAKTAPPVHIVRPAALRPCPVKRDHGQAPPASHRVLGAAAAHQEASVRAAQAFQPGARGTRTAEGKSTSRASLARQAMNLRRSVAHAQLTTLRVLGATRFKLACASRAHEPDRGFESPAATDRASA